MASSTAQGKSVKTLSEVLRSVLLPSAALTVILFAMMVWFGAYDISSTRRFFEQSPVVAGMYGFMLFIAFYIQTLSYFSRGEIAQVDVSQALPRRPRGLTVFAVINFIIAAVNLYAFYQVVPSPEAALGPTIETFFFATILIVSGIGFLRMSYRWGYVAGLAYAIGAIIFPLVRSFTGGLAPWLLIPILIYPMLLALLLVVKYRPYFSFRSSEPAE